MHREKGAAEKEMKRKAGDRKDGILLRDIEAMTIITPIMFPNRCDNEAYISEVIDLTKLQTYLEKRNGENPEYKYNLFQVVTAALLKVLTLRPKLNRFIANQKVYMHRDVSAAFVVKKQFSDHGEEALAVIHAGDTDTLDTLHDAIYGQITDCRSDRKDTSSASMEVVKKLPTFVIHIFGYIVRFLDRHGWMPTSLVETDPYQCSVVLSNVGSIHIHSGYHHLTNWGTTSVFCLIGEIKKRPFFDDEGNVSMRESVKLGLTIDERVADGYYYSKSIRLLKKLLECPELLEKPLSEEVEY